MIPEVNISLGIELLVLVALSLPTIIFTFIWERKYKALLAAETEAEKNSDQ